jgi:hypothetical protein
MEPIHRVTDSDVTSKASPLLRRSDPPLPGRELRTEGLAPRGLSGQAPRLEFRPFLVIASEKARLL